MENKTQNITTKWEDSISTYPVEEILNVFDHNIPEQESRKKWSLMFEVISKLSRAQLIKLITKFVAETKKRNRIELLSSLSMNEEEKRLKTLFTESHPFYSILYYNLDLEALQVQDNASNFISSLWLNGYSLSTINNNCPYYCPLYFLLATNKSKKRFLLHLFFGLIYKISDEEKQKLAIINFYCTVLSSKILENIVNSFIVEIDDTNALNLSKEEKSQFLKIRDSSLNVLKVARGVSPSWITEETCSDKKNVDAQFAFKIYSFALKIEQKSNPTTTSNSTSSVLPIDNKTLALATENNEQHFQKQNVLKRKAIEVQESNDIVIGREENEQPPVEIQPEINIYNVIDLIDNEPSDKKVDINSHKRAKFAAKSAADDKNIPGVDSMETKTYYISNAQSHAELCDRLEYYFSNKGTDRKNPFITYDKILLAIQHVLSAAVDFIAVQHKIGASVLLHLYLSNELTPIQKKGIALHCLSMICPMDTSMSQLEVGSAIHNIDETDELENTMLMFYIRGQKCLIEDLDHNNIDCNSRTFLWDILPQSYRSALMFLKNRFQNMDQEENEKRKETNILITKGTSLIQSYINILETTFTKVHQNKQDENVLLLKEIFNLALEYVDFINEIGDEYVELDIESNETKQYILDGLARCFHGFFSIIVKIQSLFMELFKSNNKFDNEALHGLDTILRSTPLFCTLLNLPIVDCQQVEEGIIPIEFRKTIDTWALLIQKVLKRSKAMSTKDFEVAIYRGIAKIRGSPHIAHCFFTASVFSYTKENTMLFLNIFVQLIHKEDPLHELPPTVYSSLDSRPQDANSSSKLQLIAFCKFAVRIFEKCVFDLGKSSKARTDTYSTSNHVSPDEKQAASQILLNKFSIIIGALALYKFARQILLESNIIKICGMVLLRGNLPVGIVVNASIILSYIFQNVIDQTSDTEGLRMLLEDILKYPGLLYGLKKRLTPNSKSMAYDYRLTGNCIEILKYVVELFVKTDANIWKIHYDNNVVFEFLKKISIEKYNILALLHVLISQDNQHLIKSIKADYEISINLLYICTQITAMLHKYRPKLMPGVDWMHPENFNKKVSVIKSHQEAMANTLLSVVKLHVSHENRKEVVRHLKHYVLHIKKRIENPRNDMSGNYWPEGQISIFCKTLHDKIKISVKMKK
jgi:hypothetical protein